MDAAIKFAVQKAALREMVNGNINIIPGHKGLLAQNGVAMMTVLVDRIFTISMVRPDGISQEQVNILVLGALSRNFVEKAIIGSTAEKILHDTSCDVLVMKHIAGSKT